jgi:type I restriction enzyme S subunit
LPYTDLPFDIPESWVWVKLGEICEIINGFTPLRSNPTFWDSKDVSWFTVADIHTQGRSISKTEQYISKNALTKDSKRIVPPKSVLLCCTASVGEYAITEIPLTTNQQFNALVTRNLYKEALNSEYLFIICPLFKALLIEMAGKTTFNFISVAKLETLTIPLPPLAEQKRIVDRIEELLPCIADYDTAENKLHTLYTVFPDKLKKSILQQAVQGKLVEQDPSDEPASVLLERIRAEREALIKAGKIKRDKNESVIFRRDNSHYEIRDGVEVCIDEELPFDIPNSWAWTRLGNILFKLTDGTHSTPKYVNEGIPFLSVKDISNGTISFDSVKHITPEEHAELFKRCDPQKGDILLTKVGTTGIPVLVDTDVEFSLFVSVALLKFSHDCLNSDYLISLLQSPLVQIQCRENTRGVGNKNWVIRDIASTLISLPPLEEQARIVSKIQELTSTLTRIA